MLRLHPCCRFMQLQTGAKIVAILDMVLGLLKLVWFMYMLKVYGLVSFQLIDEGGDVDTQEEVEKKLNHLDLMPIFNASSNEVMSGHKAVSLLTLAAYNIEGTVVNLIIFVVLYVGAVHRNEAKCLTWFYIRGTVLVFKFTIVIICLVAGRTLLSQLPFIAVMMAHVYGLWVVNDFIDEIRLEKKEKRLAEAAEAEKRASVKAKSSHSNKAYFGEV